MFVISALTKPTSSPTATTPSTRPWNVGRAGLWLFTKLAGSPLEVPTSMPGPDTENVTTSEAVGTTAPLASTTATWVTRTRHAKKAHVLYSMEVSVVRISFAYCSSLPNNTWM